MSIICSLCRKSVKAAIILCSRESHDVCIPCYERRHTCRVCIDDVHMKDTTHDNSIESVYDKAFSLSQYLKEQPSQSAQKEDIIDQYQDKFSQEELCTLLEECLHQGWLSHHSGKYTYISH